MDSICGEMHTEPVYILRKQKVSDTVFYLGDAAFYHGDYTNEIFVYNC